MTGDKMRGDKVMGDEMREDKVARDQIREDNAIGDNRWEARRCLTTSAGRYVRAREGEPAVDPTRGAQARKQMKTDVGDK